MPSNIPFIRFFSRKHPAITIALSAVALIVSILIISRAEFDTDITRLIPLHAEKTSLYFDILERFGAIEKTYVIFSSNRIMDHIDDIDKIGSEISSSGFVNTVEWRISENTGTFLRDVFAKKAVLMLSEKEMADFISRLSPEGMSRELEKTKQRLALPGSPEILAEIDPLNFFDVFFSHMPFSGVSFDSGTGYFLTPDGKKLIMILSPKKSPRDISFSGEMVNTLERILRKYRTGGFNAEITGSHAIALHEASVMKSEITKNILMSFLGVMVIFIVFFRSLKGLLYVILPVFTSIIATTGLMMSFTGSLSEVTGAFAGLIVGLGIDIGIILYVRYLVNSAAFTDMTSCMDKSISDVYRGITTGVVTTALIFFPMMFSSFKGIKELGLFTGTGILLCWVFLFGPFSIIIKPSSGKFVEIKAIRKLSVFASRKPFKVISITAAVTVLLAFFIPRIHVTGEITELGTGNNPARKILEDIRGSYIKEQGVFITEISEDLESALARSLRIKETVSRDMKDVVTAGDILPPISRQEKNIGTLASLNAEEILDNFDREAAEKGFNISGFHKFKEGLKNMLYNREPLTIKDMEPVKDFLGRLIAKENNGWRIIVTGNLAGNNSFDSFEGMKYTGPVFIRQELLDILKKDAVLVSAIGLILVNIILYIDFRKFFYVLLCQIPVFISILWTLGIMGLLGISLNFMNAIVFVMLIGIGTDYTVHLLHRYSKDRDIENTFLQTGKAVLVAGLTTIAGFGSIGFSSYRGLATMGQVAAIGTGLCVILSLCIIPSFLKLYEKTPER
ncbi:MAG: MMPL family transporter [Nitrospirota bacterium]